MKTEFRHLMPAQAWEAERRSLAIGIAGWVVVASLQVAGAIPKLYRPSLAPASGLVATFLVALALFVAHYHRRWWAGVCAAVTALVLPCAVNVLWVRFSDRSLLYPLATAVLAGAVGLYFVHRKYSGAAPGEDPELVLIEKVLADFRPTWVDRVSALCILVGLVLLFVLLWR
jgi:hypothetical protein